VLDRLSNNPFSTRYVAIRGNHVALFEAVSRNPSAGDHWGTLGGLATLHSYGVSVDEFTVGARLEQATRRTLRAAIPEQHLQFLSGLRPSITAGKMLFFAMLAFVRVFLSRIKALKTSCGFAMSS
jgi:serine/threonine protein phosphatase 1